MKRCREKREREMKMYIVTVYSIQELSLCIYWPVRVSGAVGLRESRV